MIAFIFTGFKINNIVRRWLLKFSTRDFSVNRVQKLRKAQSSGLQKRYLTASPVLETKQSTSNNGMEILWAVIFFLQYRQPLCHSTKCNNTMVKTMKFSG